MGVYEIEAEEVVEREVKTTGNGAHVYIPKSWAGQQVKVVRIGEDNVDECAICGKEGDCEEWVWIDDGGGAYFDICGTCRDQVEAVPDTGCAICGTGAGFKKSEGFQPIGPHTVRYKGCDECRKKVLTSRGGELNTQWESA